MKYVFVVNDLVTGIAAVHQHGVASSVSGDDVDVIAVADDMAVDVGWACLLVDGVPAFSPPALTLPLLTPMTFYLALTPAERMRIKASQDPMVMEFWATYQLSVQLNKPIDPNLVSVQEAIGYLAAPADPGPGAGILASPERITQILAGIPQ